MQIILFLIAPVLCALVCLYVGRMHISVKDLFASLRGVDIGRQKEAVLWSMWLPRVLLAGFIVAGLSVSGCVFQSMYANPLATPDTLGIDTPVTLLWMAKTTYPALFEDIDVTQKAIEYYETVFGLTLTAE